MVKSGKFVYGAGDFARYDESAPPPAMPEWSPVRSYGGYQPRADRVAGGKLAFVASCGCAGACAIHGHAHATAWATDVPVADDKSFWGALGCSCWAF